MERGIEVTNRVDVKNLCATKTDDDTERQLVLTVTPSFSLYPTRIIRVRVDLLFSGSQGRLIFAPFFGPGSGLGLQLEDDVGGRSSCSARLWAWPAGARRISLMPLSFASCKSG